MRLPCIIEGLFIFFGKFKVHHAEVFAFLLLVTRRLDYCSWGKSASCDRAKYIKADRLSCQKFIVNQFRLFLSQAAYILMLAMRQAARGTKLAKAQVSRLRETVIKTAAKVSVSVRRVLVELAAHCHESS